LPWDTIAAAGFTGNDRVSPYLDTLHARSAARIAKDPDFIELQKDRDKLRQIRETKSVSLNEAERRDEKAQIEARVEARKKDRLARAEAQPATYEITLKNVNSPGLGAPLKKSQSLAKSAIEFPATGPDNDADETAFTEDTLLGETENILADYVNLLSGAASSIVVQR
jgi:hypothetical protein